MKVVKNRVYFCGGDTEEHLKEAKQYIKDMGFTFEQVKIVRRKSDNDNCICVVGK